MNYKTLRSELKELRRQGIYKGKLAGKGITKKYLQAQYDECISRRTQLEPAIATAKDLSEMYLHARTAGKGSVSIKLSTKLYQHNVVDDGLYELIMGDAHVKKLVENYFIEQLMQAA